MLRLSFLIIFSILFAVIPINIYGQHCKPYFITLAQKETVKFELFSITPKDIDIDELETWFSKTFFPKEGRLDYGFLSVYEIKKKIAEKFLKNYKSKNFVNMEDFVRVPIEYSGNSRDGMILLNNLGDPIQPTLLRISSGKYGNFYYFGYFVGGCNRSVFIDLEKHFVKITRF